MDGQRKADVLLNILKPYILERIESPQKSEIIIEFGAKQFTKATVRVRKSKDSNGETWRNDEIISTK